MFGAAWLGQSGLSASRSMGFRITPRRIGAAPRRPMLRKCFRQRRISKRARRLASPSGASPSSDALFLLVRASCRGDLPSVCRNVPEVCRKTWFNPPPAAGHAA
jgi:hypothetical protein